jgi:hypothetical protein
MHMLSHRVHLLLDDERYERIASAARARKVSAATVIREAIDRGLPPDAERRRRAVDDLLAAGPMDVPADPADLKAEISDMHDRRVP